MSARVRGRDLATGIVLGASTGVAALFLYLDTTTTATTGATQHILFGSIFTITPGTVPLVVGLRRRLPRAHRPHLPPLLLSSVDNDLAAARGVPVRLVGLAFMLALAVAVGLSSLAIGAILSTALLIGPAATALRITKRVGRAVLLACGIGVSGTWLGVLLAYDSSSWESSHQGLPVSFFIVAVLFAAYLATELPGVRSLSGRRATTATLGPDIEP